MSKWKVTNGEGQVHCFPLDEEAEHVMDTYCSCKPVVEDRAKRLIIHNEFKEKMDWEFAPTPQERHARETYQLDRERKARLKARNEINE